MNERHGIFISHASPEDNEFTIWLGAKSASAGYAQSAEESWEECERRAKNLAKLLLPPVPEKETNRKGGDAVAVDLFGNPIETHLVGNPIYPVKGRVK